MQLNSAAEPHASLETALAHATRLLAQDAMLAAQQADEILKAAPGNPRAELILGAAYRISGRAELALDVLEPLARRHADAPAAHLELALARAAAGRDREAIASLQCALRLKPDSADAWRLLADQLHAVGDVAGADQARARYLKAATQDPRLMAAAAALVENDLPRAEARLRAHLAGHPTDVAALRMLAEVAARLRRYEDARELLERCLKLAPGFDAARCNYALVLNRLGKPAAALPHVERLLEKNPRDPGYRNLQAAILANLGDYAESIEAYESVLREFPGQPKIWTSYGHALKTAGRQDDSVAAYRRAITLQPTLGEAYWSLANLKTFRFAAEDLAAMHRALQSGALGDEDRLHFEFALGKALEDAARYPESFAHYAAANAIHRKLHEYRADVNSGYVERSKAQFTRQFFSSRRGGCAAPDPIFIVGLPRAGSTLLEQILASHPLVEGTMELPDMPRIARELAGSDVENSAAPFLSAMAALTAEQRRSLGERYLASTRVHRKTAAPFFIDKMPNNWLHVALIRLILPHAKIVDARRHPLGCCFSGFKQHFARGQSFSYSLDDIGRYYRDYVELMAHFDRVLPGAVLRVHYETLIEHTEAEVRRLLAYCGLPFEHSCLRFHENRRPVRTPSAAQVRQPIFREGLDQWRHFEPWLDPLKAALGPVLTAYPDVPSGFHPLPAGDAATVSTTMRVSHDA